MAARGPRAAEVFIYDEIGGGFFTEGLTAKDFAAELRGLGQIDRLDVRVNSYGGDVAEGLSIYRLLAEHPAHITMHIDGVAASIASALAMAGDEIIIAESSTMMIHEAWGGLIGTAEQFEQVAQRMRGYNETLAKLYADRTGNSMQKIRDWMRSGAGNMGTWFTSTEAVAAGFASQVAENVKIAANGAPHGMDEAKAEFERRSSLAVKLSHRVDGGQTPEYHAAIAAESQALLSRLSAYKLRESIVAKRN